jgi:Tol biopolymer transport system component
VQRVTHNDVYDAEVSISPDGQWIVFGRQLDGNMDLWRMRADGTGLTARTPPDTGMNWSSYPAPDGTKMAFGRSLGQGFMSDIHVHVMDVTPLGLGPRK